ncbi:hypothetical protein J6590_054012 [Homalodisca vitripennis]|nr:hypothetical protein J6590_054012 [Homalodisca vitripennis]
MKELSDYGYKLKIKNEDWSMKYFETHIDRSKIDARTITPFVSQLCKNMVTKEKMSSDKELKTFSSADIVTFKNGGSRVVYMRDRTFLSLKSEFKIIGSILHVSQIRVNLLSGIVQPKRLPVVVIAEGGCQVSVSEGRVSTPPASWGGPAVYPSSHSGGWFRTWILGWFIMDGPERNCLEDLPLSDGSRLDWNWLIGSLELPERSTSIGWFGTWLELVDGTLVGSLWTVRRRIVREIYLYRMVRDLTGTSGWNLVGSLRTSVEELSERSTSIVRRRIAREIYLYRMVRDLTGTGGWYLGRLIMDGPKKNCSRDLPLSDGSGLDWN